MSAESSKAPVPQVLAGVRVIELGQLIAGPFCGKMLADFGADVIKVEAPGEGDPLRKWRLQRDGTSFWWQIQSRNKRSIVIDLRSEEGRTVARTLIGQADVLIENFKPGTLEAWGLGWSALSALSPGLVMLRVSGFGQDGPYRDRPGFGAVAEAIGGLRHLTGEPGRIPVRTGVAIGDTLAALHGAIGVLLALYHRKVNGGLGQVVDVALYESVFNCMDSLLPEYRETGAIRQAVGSALAGVAPSNAYPCIDGVLLIAGNGDSIFKRLMELIGRNDMRDDKGLASNDGRVARSAEVDTAISAWSRPLPLAQALELLAAVNVPASKIYTAKDISEDPHYAARGMIQTIKTRDGYDLDIPGIVPKLSDTPGEHRFSAPRLGADTTSILMALGLSEDQIDALRAKRIVE